MFKGTNRNPLHVLSLLGLFAALGLGVVYFPPTLPLLGLGYLHFLWFGFSSSLYYHRVLCHRAAVLAPPLELFFLLGGLIGLSGDPVQWTSVHRFHHQNSDTESDPHTPKQGFWHALFGWYLRIHPKKVAPILSNASDLSERGMLRWARGYTATTLVHLAYSALVFVWGGWNALIWVVSIPILVSFFSAWALIATFCHLPSLGEQPFPETKDRSRDVKWMAPLTFGEALHNTHHRYSSVGVYVRHWYDLDWSGYLLVIFEKLGLARNLRRLPK